MIEITRQYCGGKLRIYIEDGSVLISASDLCHLLNDKDPARRLRRAGVPHARYRMVETNGGVQKMRLATPKECAAILKGVRRTPEHISLLDWLCKVAEDLDAMARDFRGDR